jgi:hypothetical protein
MSHPAVVRTFRLGEQPQQRRLSAAVEADDADPVGIAETERHLGK